MFETAETRKGEISTSTCLVALTSVSSRRRTARGFCEPEFGRQLQGFRTNWLTDIVPWLTKTIALPAWRTVINVADTANNVLVT